MSFIGTTNLVGVGTTNPSYNLDVSLKTVLRANYSRTTVLIILGFPNHRWTYNLDVSGNCNISGNLFQNSIYFISFITTGTYKITVNNCLECYVCA